MNTHDSEPDLPSRSSASSLAPSSTASSAATAPSPREPGARRRKLAGYLRAANELRQSYQSHYASGWRSTGSESHSAARVDGVEHDAAVVRSGEERMVIFPSYARRHAHGAMPLPAEEKREDGDGGEDDPQREFWRQRWDQYEERNAVVDVDVRGWIYAPQHGALSRKQRLFVGLARQLVGLQAPGPEGRAETPGSSRAESRVPSPGRGGGPRTDEEIVREQAREIVQRGEEDVKRAERGEHDEGVPRVEMTDDGPTGSGTPPMMQKHDSLSAPAQMTREELTVANANLMARLNPFMANPMQNMPVSAFFYNDDVSRQRTVYTDTAGYFALRAALDFVPTHVRILAGENLSAAAEVHVIEPSGVSLISDIDDTIKHTAMLAGAREIFRNAFIRDVQDLTIEGVREWYGQLLDMGVKFHYVSNSPWQLFPVLETFLHKAGLPPGSIHLKRYSGMLQGIFEPVAERKKSSLDRISRDFPDRRFILVGDSGEADLEVYTEFAIENPGRVLAIFIRDITTRQRGFFDASMPETTGNNDKASSGRGWLASTNGSTNDTEDDPDLQAAIRASLKDLEDEYSSARATDRRPSAPAAPQASQMDDLGDLIDLSEPDPPSGSLKRANTDMSSPSTSALGSHEKKKPPPKPPSKPSNLRSASISRESNTQQPSQSHAPSPPPKPRRLSSSSADLINLSGSPPPLPPKPLRPTHQQSQSDSLRDRSLTKQSSACSHRSNPPDQHDHDPPPPLPHRPSSIRSVDPTPQPAPPTRRGLTAYPAAAAAYASNRVSDVWNYAQGTTRAAPGNGEYDGAAQPGQPLISKREQLWRVRWARAEQMLRERGEGAVLFRWKVGADAVAESVKIVEAAVQEERKL